MPGSQIVWWERIKTSKAKIRRARLGKGGGGGVSPQPPRVFRISLLLNDFPPSSRSLEQARLFLACVARFPRDFVCCSLSNFRLIYNSIGNVCYAGETNISKLTVKLTFALDLEVKGL